MLFIRVADEAGKVRLAPVQDVVDELNLVLKSDKPLFNSWLGDATGVICNDDDVKVHNHRITSDIPGLDESVQESGVSDDWVDYLECG